jgi:hypothetical protein
VKIQYIGKNKKGNLQFEADIDGKKVKAHWQEKAPENQEADHAVVVSYNPAGGNPQLVLSSSL